VAPPEALRDFQQVPISPPESPRAATGPTEVISTAPDLRIFTDGQEDLPCCG
jgi:hypothetical protein